MTDYLTTDSELEAVADAIRAKGATSALLVYPNGFVSAINAIPTGITPTGTKSITISAAGTTTEDVTNYASAEITVPSGSASAPATTITANPTISVSSTGLITASVSGSQNVTPSVSPGYVSAGTPGAVSVSGSNTSQMPTQAAQTITPTTADQTIASGKYLTGTQTIKGDANLVAENIADGVSIFGVTGTHQGGGGGSVTTVAFGDDAMFVGDEIGYVDGSGVFHDGLSYLAIMSAVSYQMLTGSIVIRSSAMGDPDMSGEVLNLPSTLTQIARWTVMNNPTPKYLFIYQVG